MRVPEPHLWTAVGFIAGAAAMGLWRGGDAPASLPAVAQAASLPLARTGYGPYPAEVLRVIDGDTLEVRVSTWPGQQVVTKVRLRGIDTPERRARCEAERALAERATKALSGLVGTGPVVLSAVGPDKYFGRVVADVALSNGGDAGVALRAQGLARTYAGRTRQDWCG